MPQAYGSYEEVLADPEVDAVYIPLPNELHKPWVFAAADAGKHVLCEKPLALDAAEARAMVDALPGARGRARWKRSCGGTSRGRPRFRALVAEGAIGELRLIRSSFSFPIDPGDWRLDPARGGGALWDVGCYGVSTARLFAGAEPESIRSLARFGPTGVDLSLTAELKFPGRGARPDRLQLRATVPLRLRAGRHARRRSRCPTRIFRPRTGPSLGLNRDGSSRGTELRRPQPVCGDGRCVRRGGRVGGTSTSPRPRTAWHR